MVYGSAWRSRTLISRTRVSSSCSPITEMGLARRSKAKVDWEAEEEEERAGSVVILSSSDDEEANKDLSLEIVERAMQREARRCRPGVVDDAVARAPVVEFSSADEVDVGEDLTRHDDAAVQEEKKKRRRKKPKKKEDVEKDALVDTRVKEESLSAKADSVLTDADDVVKQSVLCDIDVNPVVEDQQLLGREGLLTNDSSDNVVLRKLLRGPRYFDPGHSTWGSCYNCGEEGHVAADCKMEKRKKPCFVCGMFGHSSYHCTKGQDCFICKRRGHIAKDCPDKHQKGSQDFQICLRCGDEGHEMSSCSHGYTPNDMKEIQCYSCRMFGHLCCVDFMDEGPQDIFCYNCAQSGHSGIGCAKPHGDLNVDTSPTICFKCGGEGHFARGCIDRKIQRRMANSFTPVQKFSFGESSNPKQTFVKENGGGCRSLPHFLGKSYKNKSLQYEGKWDDPYRKSKSRGGWIVDDPGDLPKIKRKANGWVTPTSGERNHKHDAPSSGHHSSSLSTNKRRKHYFSNSQSPAFKHGFSAPRFSSSHGRFNRS